MNYSIVESWKLIKSLTLLLVLVVYWEFGILDQHTVVLNDWILLGKMSLPNSNQLSGSRGFDYKVYI
ncbi:hypothetical protein C5167_028791 [Papaver somniferum]|nr:hypothetical protein C5167_028791 [Papaver somniferum]